MRDTDGLQTTITFSPVNRIDQTLSLELSLGMSLPLPHQDEHLPDQIEAYVHQAGLEFQRRLFQVLIEKADQELVLQRRHGKDSAGIQRKGTRPFTFKTIFGAVTVGRSRILHKADGTMEVPAAVAWNTSHQLMITQFPFRTFRSDDIRERLLKSCRRQALRLRLFPGSVLVN